MRSYGKNSKATICMQMKKSIVDIVVDKRKENQKRQPKLPVRQKRNILRQIKILQEESKKVRAGSQTSVSDETVCRVLKKVEIRWRHAQKKNTDKKKSETSNEICLKS